MKKSLFFNFLLISSFLSAQIVVLPSGGDGSNVSFSIGESVVGVASSNKGMIEIGVQQPYSLVITAIDNVVNTLSASVNVYPNPTASLLHITLDTPNNDVVDYKIVYVDGQIVADGCFLPADDKMVDMAEFPAGSYTLILKQGNMNFTCKILRGLL